MTLDDFFRDNADWRPYADLIAAPPSAGEIEAEFPKCDPAVLTACDEGFPTVGALYVRIRREGNHDRFAAMLALQQAPRIMTDSVFCEGWKRPADEFDPHYMQSLLKSAKRQGFTPPPGARYFPGLARFRGDKEAWVGQGDGRAYIKKLCETRGWACEGAVNTNHREPDSDPHKPLVPLAGNLVKQNAKRMIEKDPSLKRLDRRELRAAVLEKHGAKT